MKSVFFLILVPRYTNIMTNQKKSLGNFGELIAGNFLIRRGFRIIGTNVKIGRWEFDLIATKGNLTFFIEVKTTVSSRLTPPEYALTRRQIEILNKAIQLYCWKNKFSPVTTRLDFICVTLNRASKTAKIKYYQNIS
jgi:putative endonuclease